MDKRKRNLSDKAFEATDRFVECAAELEEQERSGKQISEKQMVKLNKKWQKAFTKAAKAIGFKDKPSIATLFDGFGRSCNWKRLHETESERENTLADWIGLAKEGAFYASDRWSVERLLRVHWDVCRALSKFDERNGTMMVFREYGKLSKMTSLEETLANRKKCDSLRNQLEI